MKKDEKVRPYTFAARFNKPFKVEIDLKQGMCVHGITKGKELEYYYRFTRPVPVKKGDVFTAAKDGIILNGKHIPRNIIPPKGRTTVKVAWVAKRLRVAIFPEGDRDYDFKAKKFLNTWGKTYWVACDLRSYQIGCGDTAVDALRNLIEMCVHTNHMAKYEARKTKVIRWRCLLPKNEMDEMEQKALKKGIILDGVEVPDKYNWKG